MAEKAGEGRRCLQFLFVPKKVFSSINRRAHWFLSSEICQPWCQGLGQRSLNVSTEITYESLLWRDSILLCYVMIPYVINESDAASQLLIVQDQLPVALVKAVWHSCQSRRCADASSGVKPKIWILLLMLLVFVPLCWMAWFVALVAMLGRWHIPWQHWIELDLNGVVTRFNAAAKIVRHDVIMLLWTDHSAAVIAALFLSEQILSERATDDTIRIYSLSLCLCFFAFQGRLSMLPPQAEVARRKS